MECVFCKIVQGTIPANIIYNDDYFLAFLDINPRAKGHVLVIPKIHAETLLDLPENITEKMMLVLQHIAKEIKNRLGARGFNILSNNGESAGQVVKHLHFHIIPRYDEKGHSLEAAFPVDENAKKELEDIFRQINDIPLYQYNNKIEQPKKEQKKQEKTEKKKRLRALEDDSPIFDQRDLIPDA